MKKESLSPVEIIFRIWAVIAMAIFFIAGCAHGEPLPTNAPVRLHWTEVPGASYYSIHYLTNGAPDFAMGTNSVNWTHYLPDRNDTQAFISGIPIQSLVVVVAHADTNRISGFSVPVTNPPVPIVYQISATINQ